MTDPAHDDPQPDDLTVYQAALATEHDVEPQMRAQVEAQLDLLAVLLETTAKRMRTIASRSDLKPTQRGAWAEQEVTRLQDHLSLEPLHTAIRNWETTAREITRLSTALDALTNSANPR